MRRKGGEGWEAGGGAQGGLIGGGFEGRGLREGRDGERSEVRGGGGVR